MRPRMSSTEPIHQYAMKVVNYSTEYGRSGSASYTACNLAGEPRLTGRYGDFTDAFVLVCKTRIDILLVLMFTKYELVASVI